MSKAHTGKTKSSWWHRPPRLLLGKEEQYWHYIIMVIMGHLAEMACRLERRGNNSPPLPKQKLAISMQVADCACGHFSENIDLQEVLIASSWWNNKWDSWSSSVPVWSFPSQLCIVTMKLELAGPWDWSVVASSWDALSAVDVPATCSRNDADAPALLTRTSFGPQQLTAAEGEQEAM